MDKPSRSPTERRMEYVEITQAEEMPVLSAEERADLIASIRDAEAQIDEGNSLAFDSTDDFADWIKAEFDAAIVRHHGVKP